jgi:Uma2 family endonuclease
MMSPAGASHGDIANTLAFLLTGHVRKRALGKVFAAETGFLISTSPDTVRAPDVAFVRKERANSLPSRGFFEGAPDLAVEVLSPDDSASDVAYKVNDWLKSGTVEVWLVDPKRKTIAIHTKNRPGQWLTQSDELVSEALFPGFRIAVADVFG